MALFTNQYEFWGDMDKAIRKWKRYLEERKKTPEKFPKYVFPPHGTGEFTRAISIIDCDDHEQILNHITFLYPEIRIRVEPAIDLSKGIEIYLGAKRTDSKSASPKDGSTIL
ncbi:MAG: hypothetical protein ACYTG6_13295 [Planctomycetota bacterium]|jgi:hypothetical protein